jgi:hypothetical protein
MKYYANPKSKAQVFDRKSFKTNIIQSQIFVGPFSFFKLSKTRKKGTFKTLCNFLHSSKISNKKFTKKKRLKKLMFKFV